MKATTITTTHRMDRRPLSNTLPARPTVDVIVCGVPALGVLDQWVNQTYAAKLVLVAAPERIDAPDCVRVLEALDIWNTSRARNLAAGKCRGDLLVFADGFAAPAHVELISDLVASWDRYDVWFMENVLRGVPYGPESEGVLAIKRWMHTRLRGFSVPMMQTPHGWGYDVVDYRLRALDYAAMSGGAVGEIPTEAVTFGVESDDARTRWFAEHDFNAAYRAHENYSSWYRRKIGWEANRGRDSY